MLRLVLALCAAASAAGAVVDAAPAESVAAPDSVVLERTLVPAVDGKGRPWLLEVVPEAWTGAPEPVATARARLDGTWVHAKVPAGLRVRLRARTEDGDVWWVSAEPFPTDGSGTNGRVDLGFFPVRGVARIGKQPLPGLVDLTDGTGASVSFVAGADGGFEGALPRDGTWTARVRCSRPAFDRTIEIEVETTDAEKPAFVDAHFRDPALRGEVVDAKGNPVEGFTLAIRETGASTDVVEKFEGSAFRYERVGPGTYDVRVTAPGQSSPTYRVRVPHDDDPDFVRAVLEPRKEFRGRVVSTEGAPVPGGWGLVNPDGSQGWSRHYVFPLGPLAEFRATLPESALRACLVLHPPGHAVRISTWPVSDEPHRFVVSAVGGVLVLEYPRLPDRVTILVKDGCFDFPASLVGGAGGVRRAGGVADDRGTYVRVVSPPMEPGSYSLCSASPAELAAFRGSPAALATCVHGALAPGGLLELGLLGADPPEHKTQN